TVEREAIIIETGGTEVQVGPIDVQFQSASLGKRMLTNFAGPMNNFMLGIIVFSLIAFIQGGVASDTNNIGEVIPDGVAEAAGLEEGDIISEIDGVTISTWHEMVAIIQQHPSEELTLTVQTAEDSIKKEVNLTPVSETSENGVEYGLIGVYQPIERSFMA